MHSRRYWAQSSGPQDKRSAIRTMVERCARSERRACALVGLSRDSYRHPTTPSELNSKLSAQIIDIAHQRRRAGYRMIHDLLRPEHPATSITSGSTGCTVRQDSRYATRKKRTRVSGLPLVPAERVNQTWSLDFVSDSLANGRRIKCPTVGGRLHARVRADRHRLRYGERASSPGYWTRRRSFVAIPARFRTDGSSLREPFWPGRSSTRSSTC